MLKNAREQVFYAEELPSGSETQERLRAWLNMLWIRPATGLQKALELKLLGRFLPFHEPAADFGCGDGTHSSLICGARFSSDFDMYLSVSDLNQSGADYDRESTTQDLRGTQYLQKARNDSDYYEGNDAFLYFDETAYENRLIYDKKPENHFDWSCDIAESLVKKARLLKAHRHVVVADLSQPLDVRSGAFKTIYSNVSYWMEDKLRLFREKCRVLDDGGVIL